MTENQNGTKPNELAQEYKNILSSIIELSMEHVQEAYDQTVELVREKINGAPQFSQFAEQAGQPPNRDDYGIDTPLISEYRNAASLNEWLMLAVMLAVFAISALHVMSFMHIVSDNAYHHDVGLFCQTVGETESCGLIISRNLWNAVHIFASIVLTEFGSLLFSMFFFSKLNKLDGFASTWDYVRVYLNIVVAGVLALISIVVNVMSLSGPYFARGETVGGVFVGLVGAIIPIMVLFLGEQLYEFLESVGEERNKRIAMYEEDYATYMENLERARARYQAALNEWSQTKENPENHPKFNEYFAQAILQKYGEVGRMRRENEDGKIVTVRIPSNIIRSSIGKLLAARTIASYQKLGNIEEMVGFFE